MSLKQVSTSQIRSSSWQSFETEGTEAPIYLIWFDDCEACCLWGAWIQDTVEIPSRLIRPLGYYAFLLIHMGMNDTTRADPEYTKSNYRTLGSSVKGRGPRWYSSTLPVMGKGSSQGGCNLQSNTWLRVVKSLWIRIRGTDQREWHCGRCLLYTTQKWRGSQWSLCWTDGGSFIISGTHTHPAH